MLPEYKTVVIIRVGFGLLLNLSLPKQILLSLKVGHVKYILVTLKQHILYCILRFCVYLFVYRNMYSYYTFH